MMSIEAFQNNDVGYLTWLAENQDGYVINIQHNLNPSNARLHRAGCRTISGVPARGKIWTGGPYIKVCSVDLDALDTWAIDHLSSSIIRCSTCEAPRQ